MNGDIKLLADQMTLLTNPKKLKIELMKSTKANEIYRKELQRFSSRKSSASDNNNSEAANHPANENQPPIIISRIKELVALKANTDFAKMPDFAFDAVKQNIINNLTEFYRLIKHGEEKESQLVQEVLGLLNIPIDQKYLPTANSTSSNSSTNSGLVM
ncbi:MAG: hypothetical protein HWD59_14710 [Coxiellaceae bacterium]|nr:MAG: hypothetical protein HWD59_14710 [Coxiellaceae bacterium]